VILGIVGHAADKFTLRTESLARDAITDAIVRHNPRLIVSGGCHLGGVDIWAEEIARACGVPLHVYLPADRTWIGGYRERNLQIAESDLVLCVVVQDYPLGYSLPRYGGGLCYHCGTRNPRHVKSGGCWTAWKCKRHEWSIIE
jgi:hypothetical protein